MGPIDELLLILLLAGLAIFLGGFLLREAPIRKVRYRGQEARAQPGDQRMRRAFEVLAQAPLERGNRVEVLQNGDELFPRLLADVRAARRLITWQVYWFKPGRLADEVADTLIERAQAGVEVLVLLDYFGSHGLPKTYIDALRAGGVGVQIYRPLHWRGLYKVPHRSHVRSVVVDSQVGYTGGFGIDDQWLGNGRKRAEWRDTHVRIEGPVIDQLQAPFVANWAECTGELLLGEGVMEAAQVAGGDSQRAAVMYASPSLGSTSAERFLALTLIAARKTLYITNAYFVPNRGIRSLLCQAAARGVDVRVLTPGSNTDARSTWYAGRFHYEELLRAGVRLYEYGPTMVHAKTLVADEVWTSIGSMNFDNRSMKLNDEVALVAQDEALGHELHEMFLRDLSFADEVVLQEFAKRGHTARLRERAFWLVGALL